MRKFFARFGLVFGYILGIYLIGRAIVEILFIDYGNSASYKNDWGGPSLIGVMAVHVVPGIIALVLIIRHQKLRRKA